MLLDEKKIFLIPSPHINYYHSYRGDSRGEDGFGMDIRIMETILNQLDAIEDDGLCKGVTRMTWDYADTFWSIQLQKEYQQVVLDRVIERCKKGKDEVLIGSWGNCAKTILDSEEFHKDHQWFLENSMGIGIKQLFKGRIAPYVRTQETMFTQGMIEEYLKLGIEGIGIYYSAIPFDVSRPFLNPRLTWNQMYSPIKFKSQISDASMLMIPMYGFGDALDNLSIDHWLEIIRKKQEIGEIEGHAMIFLNFDMDADTWIGIKLPKFIQWMPNSRGIREIAEAVDKLDYAEFGNLLEIVPKMSAVGETILKEDVADGCFNGYYNWAQKYNNTRFWTIGQRARWFKCIADNIVEIGIDNQAKNEIDTYLRGGDDLSESYLKNKILFASTTNWGMSMPFLHKHRHITTNMYGIKSLNAAQKAAELAINDFSNKIKSEKENGEFQVKILPIIKRGSLESEKKRLDFPLLIHLDIPEHSELRKKIKGKFLNFKPSTPDVLVSFNGKQAQVEMMISQGCFNKDGYFISDLEITENPPNFVNQFLKATPKLLNNEYITLRLDDNGKITSFLYRTKNYACPSFLESSIIYGKKKGKHYCSKCDKIIVLRDGSDGITASLKVISEFEIILGKKVVVEKILSVHRNFPFLFVKVEMKIPDIKGKVTAEDSTVSVETQYSMKWLEIMPCEVRPSILGMKNPLKIWKHNFIGHTSYFDLDMKEVDPKNKDIDCLVANVSDGWMGISNEEQGLLIGFNSIETANFAFSPIKIRDTGFKDLKQKGQQIRINPFGTYFGKMLHYWTEGTGHAQLFSTMLATTFQSTAPTYSGKTIGFDLVIAPFVGGIPPEDKVSFANHFSMPPLVILEKKDGSEVINNYSKYEKEKNGLIKEFDLDQIMDKSYLEWVKDVNQDFDSKQDIVKVPRANKFKISVFLKILRDGLKDKKLKKKRLKMESV